MTTTLRVMIKHSFASGGRKGWVKHVTGVDPTKDDGYSLLGEFLNERQYDLPEGSIVVTKDPAGSGRDRYHTGSLCVVRQDPDAAPGIGCLFEVGSSYRWDRRFLDLRDAVARALAEQSATTAGTDPKTEAIAEILRLMTAHNITVADLAETAALSA